MEKSILKTVDDIQKWFSPIPSVISMDWETTGLKYLQMEPVGVSFCDGERACYVENMEQPVLLFLSQVFRNGRFIAHNAKFDLNCCVKFLGVVPTDIFDTYTAAFLLDENRDSYKLKDLAQIDLGVPAKQILKWQEAESFGYKSDQWYEYCFNDSIWAFQLYRLYAPKLKKEKLDYLFYQVEMPFIPVLAYMERTGILVDKPRLLELQQHLEKKLIELEDQMLGLCHKTPVVQLGMFGNDERLLPINFNSSQQIMKVLEGFGLTIPKNREGKKSLDKKLIAPLKGKHPFLDLYLEYKTLTKLLNSYVLPAWSLIEEDGRIRPSFGNAKTGRLTCHKPSFQNLPRVSKKHPELNYRSIVRAMDGCSLLALDYSGQELRLLGIVAKDPVIIGAFLKGLDLHLLTANRCFNLNLTDRQMTEGTSEFEKAKKTYEEQRYKAKNGANFPIIYGTTAYGVSWRQGVSVKEAKRWIDSFFELYPNVKSAMDDTKRELQEKGFVTTLFGRRRRFPGYELLNEKEKARCLRQAFNCKVQGTAADQVKIAMAKIHQTGYSIILAVHDEVLIEHPSEHAQEAGKAVQELMENAVSFCIPFKVDFKIAENYGKQK